MAPHAHAGYDPIADFVCISRVGEAESIAVVPAALPVKTLREFIELAKGKPGRMNYVTGSTVGSATMLMGEVFKKNAGIDLAFVPYSGAAPALAAVAGGEEQFSLAGMGSAAGLVQGGQLRALAVTGPVRSPLFPDVPTFAEQGIAGLDAGPWYVLVGPKGMPAEVVDRLHDAVVTALADAALVKKFDAAGVTVRSSTPAACTDFLKAQYEENASLVKALGLAAK